MKKEDFNLAFKSAQDEVLKEFSFEKIRERLNQHANSNGKISMEDLSREFFLMNMDYTTKLTYSVLSKVLGIEE